MSAAFGIEVSERARPSPSERAPDRERARPECTEAQPGRQGRRSRLSFATSLPRQRRPNESPTNQLSAGPASSRLDSLSPPPPHYQKGLCIYMWPPAYQQYVYDMHVCVCIMYVCLWMYMHMCVCVCVCVYK